MLFISEDQVKNIMTIDMALQTIRQAFLDFSHGLVEVPPRITINFKATKNSCIFLPAN